MIERYDHLVRITRMKNIMEIISSIGVDPKDISLILRTHCHYDHCGNASYLKK